MSSTLYSFENIPVAQQVITGFISINVGYKENCFLGKLLLIQPESISRARLPALNLEQRPLMGQLGVKKPGRSGWPGGPGGSPAAPPRANQ